MRKIFYWIFIENVWEPEQFQIIYYILEERFTFVYTIHSASLRTLLKCAVHVILYISFKSYIYIVCPEYSRKEKRFNFKFWVSVRSELKTSAQHIVQYIPIENILNWSSSFFFTETTSLTFYTDAGKMSFMLETKISILKIKLCNFSRSV